MFEVLHKADAIAMITKDQVVPLLLDACPTARARWDVHLAWWNGEAAGGFNDVSVFAQHIVDSYAKGSTSECEALFATVERILEKGDQRAKELAAVGLLEDVQTIATHHPFGPAAFEEWLGPKSRQAWKQMDAVWHAGGGSLAGVVRLEQSLAMRRKWWQFWKRKV